MSHPYQALAVALVDAFVHGGEAKPVLPEGRRDEIIAALTHLMADWRHQFGARLPFLIVQLASHGAPPIQPGESDWAELREAQRLAVANDARAALAVAIDIEIHERDIQRIERIASAEHGAVELRLRPMQRAMILRDACKVTAEGLALIEAHGLRIEAIRPPADRELSVGGAQRYFTLIARTTTGGDALVASDSFECRGRRRESQIEIPALRSDRTERPNRHRRGHAAAITRVTWHTAAGIPRSPKNCIQRR